MSSICRMGYSLCLISWRMRSTPWYPNVLVNCSLHEIGRKIIIYDFPLLLNRSFAFFLYFPKALIFECVRENSDEPWLLVKDIGIPRVKSEKSGHSYVILIAFPPFSILKVILSEFMLGRRWIQLVTRVCVAWSIHSNVTFGRFVWLGK